MKVKDLIDILQDYDKDMEVVIKPCNSTYVDSICTYNMDMIRTFWGNDRECLILRCDEQVGAV